MTRSTNQMKSYQATDGPRGYPGADWKPCDAEAVRCSPPADTDPLTELPCSDCTVSKVVTVTPR
jgi:hypothetical protein